MHDYRATHDPLSWLALIWAIAMLIAVVWLIVAVPIKLVRSWPCWARACTVEEQCQHHYVYDREHQAQLCHR